MIVDHPDRNDPYRACTLSVTGTRADRLVDDAVRQAALFLREPEENLYAANVDTARPVEHSRFRTNLSMPAPVIRWGATITVRLLPEIVEQRRGSNGAPSPSKGRKHLRLADRPSPGVTEENTE